MNKHLTLQGHFPPFLYGSFLVSKALHKESYIIQYHAVHITITVSLTGSAHVCLCIVSFINNGAFVVV